MVAVSCFLRLPPRVVGMADAPLVSSVPADASREQLLAALTERDGVIEALVERLATQAGQIDALMGQVAELEARLGKNSRNSSKPPSSDDVFTKPPPRSLRKPSGCRPGKQNGDSGSGLARREVPDEVIVHAPGACAGCGADLTDAAVVAGELVRQVFDIPPVELVVTEHRAQRRVCTCGAVTTASFPDQATAPTCYGPAVAALGTYLMGRQHLPVARCAELMGEVMGAPVSTGFLAGLPGRAAGRLDGFLTEVRDQLSQAPVAHFDETGARAAGRLSWVHVAGTDRLTYYHLHDKRGKIAMDSAGVLPDFTGVAVHDGLAAYRQYADATHGLCNAHHLRELAAMAEATGHHWPGELAELLVQIHRAVAEAKARGRSSLAPRRLAGYRARYEHLVRTGQQANPPPPRTGKRGRPTLGPAGSLLRRLDEYREDVLRFAADFTVPFDNNQAERDVRMVKLQQKISGSWRTTEGARAFLDVRSYLSTALKHAQSPLAVLRDLFTGNPWTPAAAVGG